MTQSYRPGKIRSSMRVAIFITFFLLGSLPVYLSAQNAYYDAKELVKLSYHPSAPQLSNIYAILNRYNVNIGTNLPASRLDSIKTEPTFVNNPIFKELVDSLVNHYGVAILVREMLDAKSPAQLETLLDRYSDENIRKKIVECDSLLIKMSKLRGQLIAYNNAFRADSVILNSQEKSDFRPDTAFCRKYNLPLITDVSKLKIAITGKIRDTESEVERYNSQRIVIINGMEGLLRTYFESINKDGRIQPKLPMSMVYDGESRRQYQISIGSEQLSNYHIPSQSDAIDALAIFIAGRLKEEASLTFFNVMRQKVNADSILSQLFPQTMSMLDYTDQFEQPTLGSSWQHAFASDLLEMPNHLAASKLSYLQTPVFSDFKLLFEFAFGLRQRKNFVDLVDYMAEQVDTISKLNPGVRSPVQSLFRFMSVINNNLTDTAKKEYFLPYSELKNMTKEEFCTFIGLLSSRYPGMFQSMGLVNSGSLRDVATFQKWKLAFLNILLNLNELEKAYISATDNGGSNNDGNTTIGVFTLWNALSNVFHSFASFCEVVSPAQEAQGLPAVLLERLGKADTIFTNLSELCQAVDNQQYSVVINNTMELLQLVCKKWPNSLIVKWSEWDELIKPDLTALGNAVNSAFSNLPLKDTALLNLLKYGLKLPAKTDGSFVAVYYYLESLDSVLVSSQDSVAIKAINEFMKKSEVKLCHIIVDKYNSICEHYYLKPLITTLSFVSDAMLAPDSKSLSKVVQSYAAPPNSYKIKRNNPYAIDLCSYPGIYTGLEWPMAFHANAASVFGFTTPLGVSFSWSCGKDVKSAKDINPLTRLRRKGGLWNPNGRSFSFIVSALDIGAVVSYRLTNSPDKALPSEVKIGQFFAPGCYFGWGFRNTPLSLLAGGQVNPQLRKFEDDADLSATWKMSLTLCYDIPLYNMWYTRKSVRIKNN